VPTRRPRGYGSTDRSTGHNRYLRGAIYTDMVSQSTHSARASDEPVADVNGYAAQRILSHSCR